MHPYRTPDRRDEQPERRRCGELDPSRVALLAAELFLVGWSLVRVAICARRGLDLDGFVAIVVLVSVVAALVEGRSRRR